MKKAVITFDIEDWQQSTWNRNLPISKKASTYTLNILDLCDRLNIKTTMFIQGKFAYTFPEVVKEICNRGHEIACHGYSHVEIFKQSRDEFKEDVSRAKKLLEDLTSKRILGYRAPDFSIVKNTLWAIEILIELDFIYDSSIFPIKHSRYGIYNFPISPVKLKIADNLNLIEFPISTFSLSGIKLPIGGGGYHRLLPSFIFNSISKKILEERNFIYYCHPYEFEKNEFKELDLDIPFKTKLHQGMGRKYFKDRFISFVNNFGSLRIMDLLSNESFYEYCLPEIDKN